MGTLAFLARAFDVPLKLTTIGEKMFAGPVIPEVREFHPKVTSYDRTSQNPWEDKAVREAILATGKKKIVMADLWTDICLAFPVICHIFPAESARETYRAHAPRAKRWIHNK